MCRRMCAAAIAERVGGTAASSRGGGVQTMRRREEAMYSSLMCFKRPQRGWRGSPRKRSEKRRLLEGKGDCMNGCGGV